MMIGRRPQGVFVSALFALAVLGSTALQAQQTVSSRFRVLIPDFQPMNGEDDDFGKDLAEELRELIDDMLTHSAVSEDDIDDALDEFDLDMDELNCILARQLAQQNNYQVVLCARYTGSKEEWRIQNIRFVDSATGEVFDVDPVMSADKMEREAAAEIVQRFQLFVEQTRVAIFCRDYAQSQQWESALQNCDRALELNPNSNTTRYTRANVLRQTERFEESLAETQSLLERDPYHENALLLGGFLATNLNQQDVARGYYNRYLELDPTNASVRMNVAYDLAQEGDPLGGMLIIEEGVEIDPDNISFYEQLGNFAFAAAGRATRETAGQEGDEISPEVAELYRKAVAAYERVFLEKGAETLVSQPASQRVRRTAPAGQCTGSDYVRRACHPESPGRGEPSGHSCRGAQGVRSDHRGGRGAHFHRGDRSGLAQPAPSHGQLVDRGRAYRGCGTGTPECGFQRFFAGPGRGHDFHPCLLALCSADAEELSSFHRIDPAFQAVRSQPATSRAV